MLHVGNENAKLVMLRTKYAVRLVDGVTLAFDAVEQVVTLVQAMPETECVVCDFDCVQDAARLPMRCHNAVSALFTEGFCATFYRVTTPTTIVDGASRVAYVPRSLFHKNLF